MASPFTTTNLRHDLTDGPVRTPQPQRYIRELDNRPEANMSTISHLTGAQATNEYSWRAPSPPHIYVPQAREDQLLAQPSKFVALGYTEEERNILSVVTSGNSWVSRSTQWKYSWRRDAQSILTFLQLGPSVASRNLDALRRDGVTMLLVIRNTATAAARLLSGDKAAQALGIESAAIDVGSNNELIAAFPRATRIINNHLISKYRQHMAASGNAPHPCGKVLVFCESGNERSAAFVVAFIMNNYGLELVQAIQFVQSQRFCVAFDDDLKYMLDSYQGILQAQRSFADVPVAPYVKPKRRRDEIEDEDGDFDMIGHGDDKERFGGRTSFVPFQ
ncbi:related to protein tyrosine phosphatase [Rhynchosporium graminicola]|uniref:Related to protein tyrosine phosphatase n=1 Tax=Rhynchosporium graminicola TaxID=2792576 RepID=A0A1E1LI61_9HELO|nr:related to protein tyrosine phosphatase [Rhynchosporium commune]